MCLALSKASGASRAQHPSSSEHPPLPPPPQEDMQPLAIRALLKWLRAVATLGPNTQSGVLGLRCLSLPETLLCSVGSAAAEWPCVTEALGASPEWHSRRSPCFIFHGLEELGGRHFFLSISRTYCQTAW